DAGSEHPPGTGRSRDRIPGNERREPTRIAALPGRRTDRSSRTRLAQGKLIQADQNILSKMRSARTSPGGSSGRAINPIKTERLGLRLLPLKADVSRIRGHVPDNRST